MRTSRRLSLISMLAVLCAAVAAAEVPQVTNYFGSIGGNLPVSVALGTDRQSHATGSYVYDQYGKPISLTGSLNYWAADRTDITLKETSPGTGTFELTVAKDGTLSGTWKSSDGQRILPVSLSPVAKTIILVSAKSDRYEVRSGYLQLMAKTPFAKALNTHIERSALDSHDEDVRLFVADIDGEVAEGFGRLPHTVESTPFLLFASDTLVSIRNRIDFYTGGRGHLHYVPENYAWVQGALVEIKPEKIIPESQWPALREMCIKELKAQGASWPKDIKFDTRTPPELNFTSRGFLVAFKTGQAGSEAEGPYIVSLPYAEVKPLIATDSPVAALAAN